MVDGQLEPVFAIFNRFQVRNKERVKYAVDLLKTEPDFTVDESFEFDRAKAPWAKSPEELNDIWRRRVKNDARVADAHRKDLARDARHPAEALRARASSAPSRSPATTSSKCS